MSEGRRFSAHPRRAMRRIWRWLCGRARSMGAGEGPESSRSSGGHELQPEGRDELHRAATSGNLAPARPLVEERDTDCRDKADRRRRSGSARPVDPSKREKKGEAAPGQGKGVSASSAPRGAAAAAARRRAPALRRADEPAACLESAVRTSPSDEEGVKESKSFGQEAEDARAQIPTVGSDSSPSHLSPGTHQPSERVDGQVFLRECHQCLRVQGKLHEDMAEMREENESLSRQLSKAERKADGLEKEVEQLKNALLEQTSALDWTERELQESKRQTLDWYGACLLKEQKREDAIKKAEELQHQLAQLQSENVLLRQQLGDAQNNSCLEQMRREAQLQGELADAVRKQHTAETALKALTNQYGRLKAENSRLQEDLDKAKAKACELSAQLELQSQKSLQLEALNKEMGQTVTSLSARLATPGAGHTTTAPEEKQYLSLRLEVQAAAEARVEEIKTAVASWRNNLEQIIRAQALELERAKDKQESTALLLACAQAELKSSDKRFWVMEDIARVLRIKLNKANERLAEARRSNGSQKAECEQDQGTRGPSVNPSGSATSERKTRSGGDCPQTSALPPNVSEAWDIPSGATPPDSDILTESY
ncbi:uncharacterized protein LOC141954092 [Strix uralensis]|uniref:uncharacterized protein LOC141954092 n=1 Tax=Strix uralensis TaxID=36305 RepID=UPI003DA6EB09